MKKPLTSVLVASLAMASLIGTTGAVGLAVATAPPAAARVADDSAPTQAAQSTQGASISCANSAQFGATAGSSLDASSLAKTLLEGVAKGAGSKVGEFFAGWALSSIFGPSEGNDQQTVALLQDLSAQIKDLSAQVDRLQTTITNAISDLATEEDKHTYELESVTLNKDISSLQNYEVDFASWLKKSPGATVDGSQSNELLNMRSNLGIFINDFNITMQGRTGSEGLIELYAKVVRDGFVKHKQSISPRFLTAEFTTPVSEQLDYYEGLTVEAFNMLAEVYHLSWTIGKSDPIDYSANIPYVESYANCVPKLLEEWNQKATDGLGQLPPTVVADTQTGLMWTRSSIGVSGDGYPFADQYCWVACGFMFPYRELSTWMTPTRSILGYRGWRVPSQAEMGNLVAGHENKAIEYLKTLGFTWHGNGSVQINNVPITVPAYWLAGGSAASFDPSFHTTQWLSTALPGPGAVAVRNFG
jgi:hypothetical protein